MKSPKSDGPPKRWVWRISQRAPLGEWVDLNAPPPPIPPAVPCERPSDLPELASGGWIVSSFDLLRGTEVDASGDTVPDELFDEFFPQEKNGTRPA